jgi:hypothetical protein
MRAKPSALGFLARLRQPHVEVEPKKQRWCHLVKEETKELEYLHHGRVKGEAKASDEEVVEDDHFVRMRLRRSLTGWRGLREAHFKDASPLHVTDHHSNHVALPEDRGRQKAGSFPWHHLFGRCRREVTRKRCRSESRATSEAKRQEGWSEGRLGAEVPKA